MTVQIEVREETAAKLQAIANAMQLSLDDYLAGIATPVPPPTSPSPLPDAPAFTMAFQDYLSLSAAERRAVALDLQERNRDWLKRQLELHRAAWIMVIGGQVVESLPRLDDYPTPERLMKLGTEHDLVPFVFSRPPLFEEISWSALPGNDFYPTLALTKSNQPGLVQMPRPCVVEFHGSCYNGRRLLLRCHELVSWSFTFAATVAASVKLHETSSWHLEEYNDRL